MIFTNDSPLLQFAYAIRQYHMKSPSLSTQNGAITPASLYEAVATLVDGMAPTRPR